MNKFCTNCGSSIVYSLNSPPKFCSSCGESLDGGREEPKDIGASEESVARIPKKMKIDYEVSYASGPKSMNDIMKERKSGLPSIPRKQYDGDPMQRALDECKPARESTDIG